MSIRKVRGQTNGSSKEDPVFVCPGNSLRAERTHGTIGWRCSLSDESWQKVIYYKGFGWIPHNLRTLVFRESPEIVLCG